MNDAEYLLAQVREVAVQLKPVEQKLRRMGVGQAFSDGGRIPGRAMECWLEIERMLELTGELTDLFALGSQAERSPKSSRRVA